MINKTNKLNFQPETNWNLDLQFNVDALQPALFEDSLPKTHPMTNDVGSPDAIAAMFNKVTYEKAASVIRMTEHIIGSANFKNGSQQFIDDK